MDDALGVLAELAEKAQNEADLHELVSSLSRARRQPKEGVAGA